MSIGTSFPPRQTEVFHSKNRGRQETSGGIRVAVPYEPAHAPMSEVSASKTVVAAASGVPRFQSFTVRGYPEPVSDPGPQSVLTRRVFSSTQALELFAS